MVRHGSGLIINVSPHKQLTRMMNEISYQLEQSGYDELTLAYATPLQKHNVSILSLCVGPIKGFKNLDCGTGKLLYDKGELSKKIVNCIHYVHYSTDKIFYFILKVL